MKYFISYSRSVQSDINRIVELLRAKGHQVWWDADISAGQPWWATIIDKIEWCEIFVFVVSEKSVQSPYCLAELKYATDRNRPILPFIIDDHTKYTIPSVVTPKLNQWLPYDGDMDHTTQEIILAVARLDQSRYEDISTPRPAEPGKAHTSLAKQFQQGVTLADNGHFDEALKQFREVDALDHKKWGQQCRDWIAKITTYCEVSDLADHQATLQMAKIEWPNYVRKYANEDGLFDPLEVAKKITLPSPETRAQHAAPLQMPIRTKLCSIDLMPAPFDWIDIPEGEVEIEAKDGSYVEKDTLFDVPAFQIAKYPITNAQFAKFVEAQGYHEKRWWTEAGWAQREKENWTEPRYWQIKKRNGADYPVVWVSWYESVAFCVWLSKVTGEKVMLPTEQQWQRAAQGDDGRTYPWGDKWDRRWCTSSVGWSLFTMLKTTPVQKYEGKGDSPYGVVDMAGNAMEWCLTDYGQGIDDINKYTTYRVLRGGSWTQTLTDHFRCDYRASDNPYRRGISVGFRIARSL